MAPEIRKLRKGSYFPNFLAPRRTAEKARVAVIRVACLHGASMRWVDDPLKVVDAGGIPGSKVSRLCGEIDEWVNAFMARPREGEWPHLRFGATYLRVREGGRIVSRAVIAVVAVTMTASVRRCASLPALQRPRRSDGVHAPVG
jgi:transposase-like protein